MPSLVLFPVWEDLVSARKKTGAHKLPPYKLTL